MAKMRLGWYAGVSRIAPILELELELHRSYRQSIIVVVVVVERYLTMHAGVHGPRGIRRALGLPPASQLLLGHGLSRAEQLLSAGMHLLVSQACPRLCARY